MLVEATKLRISTGTKIYITKRKRKIGWLARVAKVGLPEFHMAEGNMLSSSEEVSEEYKRVVSTLKNPSSIITCLILPIKASV
jgi:hypothetical protein